MAIRVFLLDDHELVRRGVRDLLWVEEDLIVNAIRRVGHGESRLDQAVTARVLDRLRQPQPLDDLLESLTAQERRILELISEGKTNRQIGETMYLAENTFKNYVSNLLTKLDMARRSEAAAYAAHLNERRVSGRPQPVAGR